MPVALVLKPTSYLLAVQAIQLRVVPVRCSRSPAQAYVRAHYLVPCHLNALHLQRHATSYAAYTWCRRKSTLPTQSFGLCCCAVLLCYTTAARTSSKAL